MAKKDTIKVQGTNKSGRVAFFEKNEAHPGGEVFIVQDGHVHEVAKTTAVKRAISLGELTTDIDEDAIPEEPASTILPLRPATEQEEDAALPPLEGTVEK